MAGLIQPWAEGLLVYRSEGDSPVLLRLAPHNVVSDLLA